MSYDCKRLHQEPSARLLRAANVYKNIGRLQLLLTYQQDDLSSKHQVLGLKFL